MITMIERWINPRRGQLRPHLAEGVRRDRDVVEAAYRPARKLLSDSRCRSLRQLRCLYLQRLDQVALHLVREA